MKHKSFVAFVLSHGRAGNVKTIRTLRRSGYTGKIIIVIDDEDTMEDDYKRIYGKENVVVFDKLDISRRYDTMDNFDERRTVFYARNACFEIAEKLGYKYFLELDDDYTHLVFKIVENGKFKSKDVKEADTLFDSMIDFMNISGAYTVAFAQGGDFIGGKDNGRFKKKIIRKAMNTFFCRTDRKFDFIGRVNEDVNTYCYNGIIGNLMMTYTDVAIEQGTTQKQTGGMTEQYLDSGTYLKSFYTVMCCPSCVYISMMGGSKKSMRLHHMVEWNYCTPKILSDKYKK